MRPTSDPVPAASEGTRREIPHCLDFARTRTRSAYADRAFASLRKASGLTFDGEPTPCDAVRNAAVRFLLARNVCGGIKTLVYARWRDRRSLNALNVTWGCPQCRNAEKHSLGHRQHERARDGRRGEELKRVDKEESWPKACGDRGEWEVASLYESTDSVLANIDRALHQPKIDAFLREPVIEQRIASHRLIVSK